MGSLLSFDDANEATDDDAANDVEKSAERPSRAPAPPQEKEQHQQQEEGGGIRRDDVSAYRDESVYRFRVRGIEYETTPFASRYGTSSRVQLVRGFGSSLVAKRVLSDGLETSRRVRERADYAAKIQDLVHRNWGFAPRVLGRDGDVILMERIDGRTLRDVIDDACDDATYAETLANVYTVLASHYRTMLAFGIVYIGYDPSNVLVESAGLRRVFVIAFGRCKLLKELDDGARRVALAALDATLATLEHRAAVQRDRASE